VRFLVGKERSIMSDLTRIEQHITLVGVFHIVYHALHFLGSLAFFALMAFVGFVVEDPGVARLVWWIGLAVGTFLGILSVPGIIGGIWLLRRREWARILTMVVGALGLINIPLGTALGVYTFWVLIQDEAIEAFKTHGDR
jgi:hypothetical protein